MGVFDVMEHDNADQTVDLCSQDLKKLCIQKLTITHTAITTLKLDYNDLTSLPTDLVLCIPNLKVFTANGNSLKMLPDDFGSLKCLTEVHLCENELTSLPDSVQNLVNLKSLRLIGNKLSSLPEDFGEMGNLKELSLDENELRQFPPTFALLNKLQTLETSHNKLCVLPKFLGSMNSLRYVDFSCNELEMIPDSFSQLEELICVDISQNKLRTLPLACSSQKTLKKFFAGLNMLTELPFWLGQLPELTDLCLKENNITGSCLPEDFGKVCTKLRYLDLCGNHLTALPESFGELQNLEFAHFGSMLEELERKDYTNGNWLTKLPASFPQLSALTKLRLDENHIFFLPDDFGSLKSLEFLDMGQNLLHDLPESFGDLQKLRVCLLSRNNIQLLPSSFGQLAALEELLIDNNLLTELPESFSQLTQLQSLDLFHNKLTELPSCLQHLTNLRFLDLTQNPLKMPKKLVPALRKCISYKPRSQDSQDTWRGRMRPRTSELLNLDVNRSYEEDEDDDGDESADTPVDELYGSEDIPYNFRFLRSPDAHSVTGWRAHSASETRPLFIRHSHRVHPVETPSPTEESDACEEQSDICGTKTEVQNSEDEHCQDNLEESWDDTESSVPYYPVATEESWDAIDSSVPYCPVVTEESWEEELTNTADPYDDQDVMKSGKIPFSYNSELNAFFMSPYDLHAPPTCRPKHDPDYKAPEPVESQFSDVDDDTVKEMMLAEFLVIM